MTTELTPTPPGTLAAQELAAAGQAASHAAAAGIMADYLGRKTANTRRRLAGDVGTFAAYLEDCGAYAAAGATRTIGPMGGRRKRAGPKVPLGPTSYRMGTEPCQSQNPSTP